MFKERDSQDKKLPFDTRTLFFSPLVFFKIVSEWLKAVFMSLTDNKLTGVLTLLILRSPSVFCMGVQCSLHMREDTYTKPLVSGREILKQTS